MKHLTAILIKFAMITIILEVLLLILTNITFIDILVISATVTAIAYLIGDLFVLPAINNTVATIADVGLAFITILMFNYFWLDRGISIWSALIAAIAIGVGEIFFHKYIALKDPNDPQ